jgi:hypothetical protein
MIKKLKNWFLAVKLMIITVTSIPALWSIMTTWSYWYQYSAICCSTSETLALPELFLLGSLSVWGVQGTSLYHNQLIYQMENSFTNHPLFSFWEHYWFNPPSNESSSLEVWPSLKWTVYFIIYERLSFSSTKAGLSIL